MSDRQPPIVLVRGMTADHALRALAAFLAAICALAYLAPTLTQLPLGSMVSGARNPALALASTRYAFGGAALFLAASAVGWPLVIRLVRGVIAWVTSLPVPHYVAVAVVVAATVRILVALVPTSVAVTDPQWYHTTAVSIANGDGFSFRGAVTAYRPPGYPWLLALTYATFGPRPALAWVWGLLATSLCLIATYRIARHLYGVPVARIATLGMASYPALAIFTALPVSDLVFSAGLTALFSWVITIQRPGWITTFLMGLLLAALTLTRNVGIAFAGPLVFLLWMKRPPRGGRTLQVAVLTVALILPLAGWGARNHAVFGTMTLATNTGRNLWLGNNPRATGGYPARGEAPFQTAPIRALNEAETDRRYLDQALHFVRAEPMAWLALLPRKLVHLMALELTGAQWLLHERSYPPRFKYGVYALTQLSYVLVAVLVSLRILSFVQPSERPRGLQWTGWLVGATVVLVALASFGQDRFRLPFLPWMLIEASVVLTRLAGMPLRGRGY